ncbi:MAG: spore coat protein CotJB [Bacilli bacterium]
MDFNMYNEIDYFNNFSEESNNSLDLFSPYEGYIKGNLFKNLYQEYKNYRPSRLNVNSEKMEMLVNIGQMGFASHELNLYLDNYPNNRKALELFNKYSNMTNKLIKEYENKYGPLTVGGINEDVPFNLENEKWPWEV